MSAETFTTAMFLITAVIAAGVLINAVFPVVYNMAGTFSSATHESDQRLRTDFKIVTTYAVSSGNTKVWMKNIGSQRIPIAEVERSDVFTGSEGNFDRMVNIPFSGEEPGTAPADGYWIAVFDDNVKYDLNNNHQWDPGETILVWASTSKIPADASEMVYYQFVLPDGIWRSAEYTVSK